MQEINGKQDLKYHLWGWVLFIICAAFFIASGIKNRDLLGLAGSIIFLIACVFFIIPLVKREKQK